MDTQSTAIDQPRKGADILVFSAGLLALTVVAFYPTISAMVSTWIVAETYTHGFLILPIVVWLAWQKKSELVSQPLAPNFLVLLLTLPAGAVWLLANIADVLVAQQLAVVAIFVLSFWAMMGNQLARLLSFPLAYLFFAVPMGEELVPPMMEYTATVLVALIKLTGIPVYRDGMFISLPSGNWSVVEACSGVRYIIASVTLGCLFAYLSYSKIKKRLIFIVISALVPVVANGLRAYMIVMLGHFSDMTLAVGVDHLIYGWLFFGLVMFVLFSIGLKWRDPDVEAVDESLDKQGLNAASKPACPRRLALVAVCVAAAVLVWPVSAKLLESQPRVIQAPLVLKNDLSPWEPVQRQFWDWKPEVEDADQQIEQIYWARESAELIGLYVYQYAVQSQGKEVVNIRNRLDNRAYKHWRIASRSVRDITVGGRTLQVQEIVLKASGRELLIWHWYRVGDYLSTDKYTAKWDALRARLLSGRRDAAIITVSTPIQAALNRQDELAEAQNTLSGFLDRALVELETALDISVGEVN